MIHLLSGIIGVDATMAAAAFTRGSYGEAYSGWFKLYAQGNPDAKLALFSASDVLWEKIKSHEATPEEKRALSHAVKKAGTLKFDDFVDRYKGVVKADAGAIPGMIIK